MTGNPTVNINEVIMTKADGSAATNGYVPDEDSGKPALIDGTKVKLWKHDPGKIGVINNVFGGGNAAEVIGTTHVNVGTTAEEPFASLPMTPVFDEHNNPVYEVDATTGEPTSIQKMIPQTKPVVGADIRGNVYGGGNEAKVTGDTNVVIGKEKVTTP